MFSASSWITLREGATIRVFVAPSLYAISKARGIDITSPTGQDAVAIIRRYAAIAFCAAIDAWEIDNIANPDKGEYPYTYGDFVEWAYNDQKGLLAFIDFASRAITGKGIHEQGEGDDDEVKKKTSRRLIRRSR